MSVVISDDTLKTLHMTADELKRELAILLYQQGRCTLGQASRMAAMTQAAFQFLLASRHIPVHYTITELDADVQALRDAGDL